MANFMFIIASFFLVVLIISQEIQSTEGRQLKLGMKKGSPELETHIKIMGKETTKIAGHNISTPLPAAPTTQVVVESQTPPSRQVEAFRPTSPGHSPGVGHSLHIQN